MKRENVDTITAILTVWKRNHLEEQLHALFGQTVCPDRIWVQQCQHHVNVDVVVNRYREKIDYTYSEENRGVFGRFESAAEVETSFVYIVDDDIIPGRRFLEKALETCKRLHAVICPHGRILSLDTNRTAQFVGDGYEFQHSFCLEDSEVDFGNNAWFFRRGWIDYFLWKKALFRSNGEDIHLSATCQLFGNIPTYVPRQIIPAEAGNIKRIYSGDEQALCRKPQFGEERVQVVQRFRDEGWKLQAEQRNVTQTRENHLPLSVVIVIDEKEKEVDVVVENILGQTFQHFELILVGQKQMVGTRTWKDRRIRWIETEERLPFYTALNIGCAMAEGKYICLADMGHLSCLDRLHSQYELLEENPDLVAAGESRDGKSLFLPSIIVRRDVLHRIKYLNELLGNDAEKELLYRLLQEGSVMLLEDICIC